MSVNTKLKILKIAAREFAQNGYRKTTIRDVCIKAGVNVAAVNYHFSGKAELYRQTVDWLIEASGPGKNVIFDDGESPEQNIRSWVAYCISKHAAGMGWHGEMILHIVFHEMQSPSENYNYLYQSRMLPDLIKLSGYLNAGHGGKLTPTEEKLKVFSLIGRVGFYILHRNLIARYSGKMFVDDERKNIIDNIVQETVRDFIYHK
jgi:hypothetical protein